jgi:outer membrane protein assembly factor BamB
MKLQKNKTLSAIALILMLTVAGIFAVLPIVKAHTPALNIPTYAFLNVAPNPVGVGQTLTLSFWLSIPPPTANGPYGDRWQDFTITVTKPDGTTQTLGPYKSDPVGSGYAFYSPTTIGNYTFLMSYSGQKLAGANPNPAPAGAQYTNSPYVNDTFLPSKSLNVVVAVEQQQIQQYQEAPVPGPNQYWQRPINGNNRGWYVLGGNWLAAGGSRGSYNASGDAYFGGGFNPYTTAPDSAHIVWTKPLSFGGIIGGTYGGGGTSSYYDGMNYELMMDPPVVMNGVIYYNKADPPLYGFYAVDLRTGKTIYYSNGTSGLTLGIGTFGNTPAYPMINCGQIYDYVSPNQFGGIPYLWYLRAPNYYMYDANTGNWILTVNNAMTGTPVYGDDGSILVYVLDGTHNWLAMWNSSMLSGMYPTATQPNALWMWRPPDGATLDWRTGIQWNVTTQAYQTPGAQSIARIGSGIVLATTGSYFTVMDWQMEIGYDAATGRQLWVQNRTLTSGVTSFSLMGPLQDGVFCEFHDWTMTWYGYDAYTGTQIWGPTTPYTQAFGMYNTGAFDAYGNLYASGYDGTIHCFSLKTGQNLWNWFDGGSGYETAYGHNTLFSGPTIADGKVYASEGHTHLQPLFRGARMVCLNATSGNELWSILGWMQSPIVADGSLIANNGYDNQLYCFGRGQTATTVTAPQTEVSLGSRVLIQGTVTDQSPGQTCLGIPAAGTPAIADASMSQWMEYLYEQQPMPTNATGVPVTLTAIDPNGNTQNIGTVTSDMLGNYAVSWKPPVPGLYTVLANFAGTNSYYGSLEETHFAVAAAAAAVPASPQATATLPPNATPIQTVTPSPQVTETPVPPPSSPGLPTTYIIIALVAIIVVVAAAALALKKRK